MYACIVDSDGFMSPPEESDDEDTIDVEENAQMQVNKLFNLHRTKMPSMDMCCDQPAISF